MKRLLLLLIFIPFIAIAQSKKPPLIESITSDTVNGKYYQDCSLMIKAIE